MASDGREPVPDRLETSSPVGRPPTASGDVFRIDAGDLSWEAEDAVVRARVPRAVYETKSARRREQWPELTVLDWP